MKIYQLLAFLCICTLPAYAQTSFPQYNGEKYALIDAKTLKNLTAYKYESIGKFKDGLALSTSRSEAGKLQYSFLNMQGREVILPTSSRMFEFAEGKARFKQGDKYGFMDAQGKTVIPTSYNMARDFKEGKAFVKDEDNRLIFLDAQGNAVVRIAEEYNYAQDFQDGFALVGTLESLEFDESDPYARPTGKYAFYSKEGKKAIDMKSIDEKINYASPFTNGIAIVAFINNNYDQENPSKYGAINTKGELIVPLKYTYMEMEKGGILKVQQYNNTTYITNYGIIDYTGKEIMPCVYNFIFEPIGNYRLFQKKDERIVDYENYPDRYGIANLQGKILVEPTMKDVYLSVNGEYLELDTLMKEGEPDPLTGYQKSTVLYAYKNLSGKVLVSAQPKEQYQYYKLNGTDGELQYRDSGLIPFGYMNKLGILNTTNHEIVLPLFDDFAPFTHFPKGDLVAVREGKNWLYLNEKMEKGTTKYEFASNFEDSFYAPVKKSGKWGVINKAGAEVAPFAFDSIVPSITRLQFSKEKPSMMEGMGNSLNYETLQSQVLPAGHFIAQKSNQWGIITWNGQTVLPFQYDQIKDAFYNYVVVGKAGKAGVVDYAGKELIPTAYQDIKVVNDLVYVRENGKEGLFDLQNNQIAKTIYDTILEPSQNYIRVIKDKKIGYLDYAGKEVLPPVYEEVSFWSDRDIFVPVTKNGKKGVLNNKFQTIVPCEYDSLIAEPWRKYIWVKKDNLAGLLDHSGKEVFATKYQYIDNIDLNAFDPANSFLIAQLNGKWGVLDSTGRAVVPFAYDYMKSDYNRQQIVVGKKNKFGMLDNNGKILIPLKYDELGSIQYDFTYVGMKKKNKWGFINKAGKEAVPATYDDAFAPQQVQNESGTQTAYAVVKKGKFWGIINVATNKVVVSCRFDSIDYLPYSTEQPIGVWRNGVQEFVNFKGESVKGQ